MVVAAFSSLVLCILPLKRRWAGEKPFVVCDMVQSALRKLLSLVFQLFFVTLDVFSNFPRLHIQCSTVPFAHGTYGVVTPGN